MREAFHAELKVDACKCQGVQKDDQTWKSYEGPAASMRLDFL